MKKILVGILITLAAVFVVKSYTENSEEKSILEENSMLIQQQIDNVSKLIVTEGHFAEVYNYKDSKAVFGPFVSAKKKALVVVNADVTVAYDLSAITFEIDEVSKTLRIKSIPEPEININPDFEYYDVSADYLNMFDASDYNKIKKNVNASLMKKVNQSALLKNADNRLISELQKFYILTHSMGWRLEYNNQKITTNKGGLQDLQDVFLKN